MDHFNRLVSQQMETMEKLLYLQGKLERCKEVEKELIEHKEKSKLQSLHEDISRMKNELREIHQTFEKQTEELIQTYRDVNATV